MWNTWHDAHVAHGHHPRQVAGRRLAQHRRRQRLSGQIFSKNNVKKKNRFLFPYLRQLHALELEVDELAGDGELVDVHLAVPVHVGQAPDLAR